MDLVTFVQFVFGGLTIGCVYSLVGLGFALTLSATELINFAQGEMVMLGAFIGLTAISVLHLPFFVVFVIASVLTGFFSVFMERFILRPILCNKSPLLNLLIATMGILIVLQAIAIIIWGREPVPYPEKSDSPYVEIFGIWLQIRNFWILGLGFASMAGLHLFFQKPMTGISWRAAFLDRATAALYGVNCRTNVALTFGISATLGGGAGVLIAPLFFASFGLGHSVLIKTLVAAAMGGFGVVGTMLGGLVLGVVEILAAGLVSSEDKNVIMYGILLSIPIFFQTQNSCWAQTKIKEAGLSGKTIMEQYLGSASMRG